MAKKEIEDPADQVAGFVSSVASAQDSIYLGIDPGLTGAIALLCSRHGLAVDIPVLVGAVKRSRPVKDPQEGGPKTRTIAGKKTYYDYSGIMRIFNALAEFKIRDRVVVCLEIAQVAVGTKKASAISAYETGKGYGLWPLFLFSKGFPTLEVTPSKWKHGMGLIGKDKNASLEMVRRLFPGSNDFARAKDHNRAEAMLLAVYCHHEYEGRLSSRRTR